MASFLRRASKLVSSVLKLQPEKTLIGTDLQGNKYYEVSPQKYMFGLRSVNKQIRLVEPLGMTTTPIAATMKVTPEWEAWLRKKRADPPTIEELQQNLEKYDIMQKKLALKEDQASKQTKHSGQNVQEQKAEKDSQTVDSWIAGKS